MADNTEALVTSTNQSGQVVGDLVPRPDPSALTAVAVSAAKDDLRRELANVRELLSERIARLESIISDLDQRFSTEIGRRIDGSYTLLTQRDDGIEAKVDQLRTVAADAPEVHDQLRERLQTDIAIAVGNLKTLSDERFGAVQQQFNERDLRSQLDKQASKDALDAALLAQKDAVAQQNSANTAAAAKSEAAFTKQIDQIGILIATLEKSLTDRITELKERIDRGEGQGTGTDRISERIRGQITIGVSIVAVLVSIVVAVILIVHH